MAAFSGLRPVAKALGRSSSTTKTRGILPRPAAMVISSTMFQRRGASSFLISRAPALIRIT